MEPQQTPAPVYTPPAPPAPLPPSHPSRSIFGLNLIIFLIYFLGTMGLISTPQGGGAFLLLALYIPHAFILIIFSFVKFFKKNTREAAMYAFTAIALGIIGFGACTVGIITTGALNGL